MVITVSCPGCSTDFPVDTLKVPEEGVYAQCSICPEIFRVERPAPAVPPSPDAASVQTPNLAGPGAQAGDAAEPASSVVDRVSEPSATETTAESPASLDAPPSLASDRSSEPRATVTPDDSSSLEGRSSGEFEAEATPTGSDETKAPEQGTVETAETRAEATEAPTFGRRDPHERAARLARVLVSDMITYHPERHRQSLESGTLAHDFEDEIEKSWTEYVQQVGIELAQETDYWREALNQVLAHGEQVF